MIFKQEYLADLKDHIRNTPDDLIKVQGTTKDQILNDNDVVYDLWRIYQKSIEDYGTAPETAYIDAMRQVLDIDLYEPGNGIEKRTYTVNLLFTKNGEEVLLVRKNKTAFKGKLNGVGGELEPTDNDPVECAIREIRE